MTTPLSDKTDKRVKERARDRTKRKPLIVRTGLRSNTTRYQNPRFRKVGIFAKPLGLSTQEANLRRGDSI